MTKAKRLNELDFGFLYLVNGTLAQVTWELKGEENIQYLCWPSKEQLVSESFSSFLCDEGDEEKTIVVIPKDYDIPLLNMIDEDIRVMVVMTHSNGEIDPKAKSFMKKAKSPLVKPVNILNRDRSNETEIILAMDGIYNYSDRRKVLKAYSKFPEILIEKVVSGAYKDDIEVEEVSMSKAMSYLDALLSENWYNVWRSMPKADMWRFFWIPRDPQQSVMYKFLTGLNCTREHRGYCPTLWVFIELFVSKCTNSVDLRESLLLFASWVRASSTVYGTKKKKGLYKYSSGQRFVGYSFEPSQDAIQSLNLYNVITYD